MAATGLALTALQQGVEHVPDSLWHKIDYFCPPEHKKPQNRRDSKRSGDVRRNSRRDSKISSDSDPSSSSDKQQRRRRRTIAGDADDAHPAATERADSMTAAGAQPSKSATIAAPSGTTAAAAGGLGAGVAAAAAAAAASPKSTSSTAAPSAPPQSSFGDAQISPSPVTFTNPFPEKTNSAFAPVSGYSDGPAPEQFNSSQLPYRGPRHSVAPMSNTDQPHYPAPQGDDYGRGGYDPSRYQPAGDYRYNGAADTAVGNYYGDDRYGARAASADPYTRRGRSSRYDDDYDNYDDRDRSTHRHRSKSRSLRHEIEKDHHDREKMREKVTSHFDTSEGALGASVLGAALGGFIGHKFGKGPIATVAGAAVGGLGVNAWEAHRHKEKERRGERALVHSSRRAPSADAIDNRTRRDLEYYGSRADEERSASRRGSRYGGDYSDDGYDSAEEKRRRRRSGSRRRRDDYDDR